MLNRINLVGRVSRDPELRHTQTGKAYATLGIVIKKRLKPMDPEDKDVDFFNIKVWGQTAEYVASYITKGRIVAVDGRMETRRYKDEHGTQREVWEVIADQVVGVDPIRDQAQAAA